LRADAILAFNRNRETRTARRESAGDTPNTEEPNMTLGSLPLLWLLLTGPAAPATDLTKYSPAAIPFASTTLLVSGNYSDPVLVLDRTNLDVNIVAAEYQELRRSRAFSVECLLPDNYGLRTVGVWVDNRYHLIPASIVEYKKFNRSYVKVEIDTVYLENEIDRFSTWRHKVHIDFFTN
jgi:hypothetical protein